MWDKVANLSFDLICGVPYTALPMATALALKINKPMLIKRKEVVFYTLCFVVSFAGLLRARSSTAYVQGCAFVQKNISLECFKSNHSTHS